ncbi:hypothetical protein [Xanthomonas translucens]|nr:hypothetical protein [Xanthomonas translucens]
MDADASRYPDVGATSVAAGLTCRARRDRSRSRIDPGARMLLAQLCRPKPITGTGVAFALDAASGRELWSFDARISRGKHYSDPAARGVRFWRDAQAVTARAASASCSAPWTRG